MSDASNRSQPSRARLVLTIAALGVVFGDIGTSPLYAFHECLIHLPPGDRTAGILGILSVIFWALVFVVSVKYMGFITRADNGGEGGMFALLALSKLGRTENLARRSRWFTVLILFGAALLYGDGVITPAVSVLGAVEGLASIDDRYTRYIPLISSFILAIVFYFQRKGTMRLGRIFGGVMVIWFLTLGVLGGWHIAGAPEVLQALNPVHAVRLLSLDPQQTLLILGSVILVVTGAEALYADMGHFGRQAIFRAWYFGAFPGLVLNYFGQGAYALAHPDETNVFFALVPDGFPRLGLTLLSIAAAVVASQALITGTYSITRQAIQLGYFPRLHVQHTNPDQVGQIYIPFVNFTLAFLSIAVVLYFGSATRLAAAYGVAVSGTMVVTTLAYFRVIRHRWRWTLWTAVLLCGAFLAVDLSFFAANIHKFVEGGWLPLALAIVVLAVMHTWKRGRDEIFRRVYGNNVTESELTAIARSQHVTRVAGAAVFMVGSPKGTPIALLHHVKSNRCLHKTVVLLSIVTNEVPVVAEDQRLNLYDIGEGIWRAVGRYGYMESPDVGSLMEKIKAQGLSINPQSATYFFNREMIIKGGNARMWEWQKSLYSFLSRNARPAKDYYRITPSQIIEIGLPLQL